jgi:hypothetical protein
MRNTTLHLTWMRLCPTCGRPLCWCGNDLHNLLGHWGHEAVYRLAHPHYSEPHTLHQTNTHHNGDTTAGTYLFQHVHDTEHWKSVIIWKPRWEILSLLRNRSPGKFQSLSLIHQVTVRSQWEENRDIYRMVAKELDLDPVNKIMNLWLL